MDASSILQPAASFHHFSALPKELRLKIWGYAFSEPRTVAIVSRRSLSSHRYHLFYQPFDPPPPMTQACTESRLEAQRHYKRTFTKSLEPNLIHALPAGVVLVPHYTYFNFEKDTLLIAAHDLFHLTLPERQAIRSLSIIMVDYDHFLNSAFHFGSDRGVIDFMGLEKLKVIGSRWKKEYVAWYETDLRRRYTKKYDDVEGWSCPEIQCVCWGEEWHDEEMIYRRGR